MRENPGNDDVAGHPAERSRPLEPGDVLGSYTVLSSLGRGGMGHVYVAADDKLGRRVALKVLPPEMSSEEHRRRFEREAKAVAALSHPNIVQVYSIQQADGLHFITMELVAGKTLAELVPEGGMALHRFLEVAIEMASAIAAAHAKEIIHRDLKPANVMVTDEGHVKILDFGLAKASRSDAAETDTSGATREGVVLGTVAYMSPEQAEGWELDPRTDVFSLGVVLYEMATGGLPFRGDSPASVISSILRDRPPDVTEARPQLPVDLARIINRCLAKPRESRYQSLLDLRNDLVELQARLETEELPRAIPPGPNRPLFSVMTGLLAAFLLVVGYFALRAPETADVLRPSYAELAATPDEETFPTLSPDGRFVAYASRSAGNWDLYLRRVGGQSTIDLTERSADDETQPAFSPDGERIAYRSTRGGGGIYVMGATGEFPRQVTDFGWNPAWSPDGKTIAFATESISRHPFDRPTTSELWLVDVASGETRRLSEGDAVQPSWSPGGERIAYWGLTSGGQRDIWTIAVTGGPPRRVTEDPDVDWNPVWGPDGRFLYFASDRGGSMNLWRIPIDASTGEARGAPEPLTAPAAFASHLSIAKDGRRLAYASSAIEHRLFAVDFDPDALVVRGEPRAIARDLRDADSPSPSPSGEWLVFSRSGRQEDILISGRDGSQRRQLTNDPARDRRPVVSPDGTRIAFYSNRGGSYEIWVMSFDGSNLHAVTDIAERNLRYPFWSPDGKRLGFSYPGSSGIIIDVGIPWGEQDPVELPPYTHGDDAFVPLEWSPDGKRIAGHLFTAEGLRNGIACLELESGRYEKLADFGWFPTWTADSEHLLFMAEGVPTPEGQLGYLQEFNIFIVDRNTREHREVLSRSDTSVKMPALSKDNRTLYFVATTFESDIWLMSFEERPTESRP